MKDVTAPKQRGGNIILYNINSSEHSFLFLLCITLHFNPTLPSSPDRVVFAIKLEQIAANIVNRNPRGAFSHSSINCRVLIDVLYLARSVFTNGNIASSFMHGHALVRVQMRNRNCSNTGNHSFISRCRLSIFSGHLL